MKKLFCLLIFLSGCSQEYLDQKAAERDHAWCQSMGIDLGNPNYQNCRIQAAQNRQVEEYNRNAVGLGMMGAGTSIYNSSQPRPATTCTTIGNQTTCNWESPS